MKKILKGKDIIKKYNRCNHEVLNRLFFCIKKVSIIVFKIFLNINTEKSYFPNKKINIISKNNLKGF